MSRFSGKCDLYDWLCSMGNFDLDFIKQSNIYIGHTFKEGSGKIIPGQKLYIESIKDLVPFYPYIVNVGSKNPLCFTVYLSEKPYPDMLWDELGHKPVMYDYYKEELEKELAKYEGE